MKDKTIDLFMKFLKNFDIVRPGFYSVNERLIADVLRDFMNTQSIERLEKYEEVLHLLWSLESEYQRRGLTYSVEEASYIKKILNNEDFNISNYFSPEAIYIIKQYIRECEKKDEYSKTYEARRRLANSRIMNKKLRKRVFSNDNNKCVSCGSRNDLTIDHIIPVVKGGGNDPDNLQTLCRKCNSSKGANNG